jgi:hypothetical protein
MPDYRIETRIKVFVPVLNVLERYVPWTPLFWERDVLFTNTNLTNMIMDKMTIKQDHGNNGD